MTHIYHCAYRETKISHHILVGCRVGYGPCELKALYATPRTIALVATTRTGSRVLTMTTLIWCLKVTGYVRLAKDSLQEECSSDNTVEKAR